MKRDLDLPMIDLQGNPFADGATLKTVAFVSITATLPSDDRMPVDQKLRLYRLAAKIAPGGVIELTVEELALLKDRIGSALTLMAVGKAFELLEQDYQEAAAAA